MRVLNSRAHRFVEADRHQRRADQGPHLLRTEPPVRPEGEGGDPLRRAADAGRRRWAARRGAGRAEAALQRRPDRRAGPGGERGQLHEPIQQRSPARGRHRLSPPTEGRVWRWRPGRIPEWAGLDGLAPEGVRDRAAGRRSTARQRAQASPGAHLPGQRLQLLGPGTITISLTTLGRGGVYLWHGKDGWLPFAVPLTTLSPGCRGSGGLV